MGTNSYVTKLKAQLNQVIAQREHWKQLAENRNSIVVTEVCPESRSVEEYVIDADSVRASWRLIREYRERIDQLRTELTAMKAVPEEVEVVAWMKHELCTRLYFHAPPEPSIPLMTVAQHNAIVAALRQPVADEREALLRDAERYRWLRNSGNFSPSAFGNGWSLNCGYTRAQPSLLDAAIDEALAAHKAGGTHD